MEEIYGFRALCKVECGFEFVVPDDCFEIWVCLRLFVYVRLLEVEFAGVSVMFPWENCA